MRTIEKTRQSRNSMDRRSFLKASTSSAVLASVAASPIGHATVAGASGSSRALASEIVFTKDEYRVRWERVQAAMANAGYENLLVWQRSASTYDKVGDVYWLTNFQIPGTGQDPPNDLLDEPWTFAAVLIRKGQEPELHIGLAPEELGVDVSTIVYGKLVSHTPRMMLKFAEYLNAERIEGRVAVVGDDVLPGKFDRVLRGHTPQIDWVSHDDFLEGPQLIKSARELEAYRIGGNLVAAALNTAMEAMIAGERECDAAARAAAVIIRGGGGFHRISVSHGAAQEFPLSNAYYGYSINPARPGDLVTVWIYGPLFAGYWMDPGRTSICGKRRSPARSALVENCAALVDEMVKAVVPGTTARDVGIRWAEIARKGDYWDERGVADLFGHGLATSFPSFVIPAGDTETGPFGLKRLKEPIKPGMVLTAEAFLKRPGAGFAGFERNFIVTETGTELLDKNPMLYW
jgi:Xaa-Pro aminopeptidase